MQVQEGAHDECSTSALVIRDVMADIGREKRTNWAGDFRIVTVSMKVHPKILVNQKTPIDLFAIVSHYIQGKLLNTDTVAIVFKKDLRHNTSNVGEPWIGEDRAQSKDVVVAVFHRWYVVDQCLYIGLEIHAVTAPFCNSRAVPVEKCVEIAGQVLHQDAIDQS